MKLTLCIIGIAISISFGWWIHGYSIKTEWGTYNLKHLLGIEYYWHPEKQGFIDPSGLVWFRFRKNRIKTKNLIHADVTVTPNQLVRISNGGSPIRLEKSKTYSVTYTATGDITGVFRMD